jgi:hypothetical protein
LFLFNLYSNISFPSSSMYKRHGYKRP